MNSIYEYLDYRKFMNDYYEFRKQEDSWYSYRFMANKIGMDAGYLLKVFQGKLNLPVKYIESLGLLLNLEGVEFDYFETLIRFDRSKNPQEMKELFQKLQDLREVPKQNLEFDSYSYFQSWVHSAIRALVDLVDISEDFRALGKFCRPNIGAKEAKQSILLLERLGMISKNDLGFWKTTESNLSTGDKWNSLAIQVYQSQMMKMANESLQRHTKESRDISSLTLTLKESDLPEARLRIADFRKKMINWVGANSNEDGVYQLNVQLFPLTEKILKNEVKND
ncbi:TIGR02147 family protein [Fibrobacterales bacterium]|nr:TIGR02147 family protein [Fibrobacterales bacterium]